MGGEDFAGGELGDGDLVVVGERQDALAGVGGAGAEVVHPSGAAQRHPAFGVEAVIAQPVVPLGVSVVGRDGFRGRAVGVPRGRPGECSVWALLVVMTAERVELVLQLDGGPGWRSGSEPALQGLVEPFGLALGLWVSRRPILLLDTEDREHVFEGVGTAGKPRGVDAAVIRE